MYLFFTLFFFIFSSWSRLSVHEGGLSSQVNVTCLDERGPGLPQLVDLEVLQEDQEVLQEDRGAPTGKQGAHLKETVVVPDQENQSQGPDHHQRKMKNCCLFHK